MTDIRNTEQAEYDARWSEKNYSAETSGYTPAFLHFMRQWVGKVSPPASTAIEIGCGDGFFSGQLAQLGLEVTGFDLSPVALQRAKQSYPACRFMQHDLTNPLPLADNSTDIIWCSEVLEHLFAPLYVLSEMHRVLRPGGMLLVTVPYHGLVKNLAIALLAFDRHYDPTYPHIRFFTKQSISSLVTRVGMKIENIGTCGSQMGLRDRLSPTNILLVAKK